MYTVGNYLLDRLTELGIRDIFGVPGDYNLKFLDHVMTHEELNWIGNANELNAAYAADGYARTKGIAALVTTFGVGELSAANGTAGSYAEKVPVVQIVGTPTTAVQNSHKLVHHTLGDGRFDHFEKMQTEINGAIAHLTADNALAEIDRVLRIAVTERCPVYINLAIDVAEVVAEKPLKPLMEESKKVEEETTLVLNKIEKALQDSKNPVVLIGNEIASFHLESALADFVKKFNLPVTVLPFGKGGFDEEDAHFIGVYTGAPTAESIKERVEKADLILIIGAKLTDSATAGFSYDFEDRQVISVGSDEVSFYGEIMKPVAFAQFVNGLNSLNYLGYTGEIKQVERVADIEAKASNLTQNNFWKFVEKYLSNGDTLVAEQGTSFFGASLVPLKSKMKFIGQPLWGSIGYTFPAMLGSQIANPASRHLLFIGDGSLQLTIQELGMTFREKLTPIVFVINNDGYTVEREIHGPNELYNDIPMWDYQNLPYVFGGNKGNVATYKVTTEEELVAAMSQARQDTTRLQWIEVVMGKQDSPDLLVQLGKVFAKQNS
nr:alpha-keto acid decarboxylase family protein [Carnobacterium maltaromaticum]